MYKAWYDNDQATFDSTYAVIPLMKIPELRVAILDHRNETWALYIVQLLPAAQNILVVVGAGHLGGERGLLALLKERGVAAFRCT